MQLIIKMAWDYATYYYEAFYLAGQCSMDNGHLNMRKLSLKNSILVNISFRSKARLEKVSSFTKLIRMICVILSFQIASNFCGLTFTKSALRFLSASPQIGIILVKKSAFNNWSYNRFKFEVTIRV